MATRHGVPERHNGFQMNRYFNITCILYIANEAVYVPTEESLNIIPEGPRPSRMYTVTGREAVWELALRED